MHKIHYVYDKALLDNYKGIYYNEPALLFEELDLATQYERLELKMEAAEDNIASYNLASQFSIMFSFFRDFYMKLVENYRLNFLYKKYSLLISIMEEIRLRKLRLLLKRVPYFINFLKFYSQFTYEFVKKKKLKGA